MAEAMVADASPPVDAPFAAPADAARPHPEPLAQQGRGDGQPGAVPRRRPASRAHPDGDRHAARRCWRSRRSTASSSSAARGACCSSSTAPTSASRPRRSSRATARPTTTGSSPSCTTSSGSPRTRSARRAKVVITTIQRLYSMLKGEPELDPEAEEALASSRTTAPRCQGAAAGRLQHGHPARVLRRHLHRRVPPLHLLAVAAGAGVLRRLPDRPHGHARQAHLRLLQPEPRDGVPARAGGGGRRELRLRGLPDPHAASRQQGSTIEAEPGTMVGYRDRQTRKMRWEAPDEDVHLHRRPTSTATSSPRTRSGSSSGPSATRLFTEIVPRPHRGAEDADLRQGRLATPRTSSRSSARSSARGTTSARRSPTRSPARSPRTSSRTSATATTRASPSPWT